MLKVLGRHSATVIIAITASILTAAVPSVAAGVRAAFSNNSHKVDGIHAKSAKQAKQSLKARRGVLVATDPKTGFLPNAVIGAIPGSKVAVASLPRVPMATNASSSVMADSATHANIADDADRLGGLTQQQLLQIKVAAIAGTPVMLSASPTAIVKFTAPAAGYVTWNATCEFISVAGSAVQPNLATTTDLGADGTIEFSRNHRVNITTTGLMIESLTANDWASVEKGQVVAVGVVASAASSAAEISCEGGRLVATYSATAVEG